MVCTIFEKTTVAVIAKITGLINHTDPATDPDKESVSITKAFVEDIKDLFRKNKSGVLS
jgi:hypothetical protein